MFFSFQLLYKKQRCPVMPANEITASNYSVDESGVQSVPEDFVREGMLICEKNHIMVKSRV